MCLYSYTSTICWKDFFFLNIFIYLLAVLGLHCGSRTSLVVAHEHGCPAACGIIVPQPGLKRTSPELGGRFFTTGPPGKSLERLLFAYWIAPVSPLNIFLRNDVSKAPRSSVYTSVDAYISHTLCNHHPDWNIEHFQPPEVLLLPSSTHCPPTPKETTVLTCSP